ncbi:MAG: MobF family relaxase, partial [Campylobacterota bacterium]|nr:MobF family relaxase [Campylobacterota bacterium]
MLTVRKLSLAQASTYYSKDNYYTQQIGEYYGKLKNELGLSDLTHDSFNNLLHGVNPSTNNTLVASKKNKDGALPALDFTLSPFKSISLVYELAVSKNDTRLAEAILKAHDNAVNGSLNHIEQEHIKSRIQKNGKRVTLNTGNCIAAKFQHDTSRDLAPQLHTHSVIFNFTKIDNKYRALDASQLLKKNSPIIKNLGQFYRQNLKDELVKAGFSLRDIDKSQSFYELSSVNDELIKAFSSRSKAIKAKVKQLKKSHPHLSDSQLNMRAFFNTRTAKKEVDRDAVRLKNVELMSKFTDVDKLLSNLQPIVKVKSDIKIDDKELIKIANQVKRQISNKYHKTPLNIATQVATKLNNPISINEIYTKIKTKEINEQKQLNSMNDVLVASLKATKLDTQKLFNSLNSLKGVDKHQIEEKLENGREPSNRDRFIAIINQQSNRVTRAEQLNNRDVADLVATTERGQSRGDEFERYDDVTNRDASIN